jgi:cell division septation protein DedD
MKPKPSGPLGVVALSLSNVVPVWTNPLTCAGRPHGLVRTPQQRTVAVDYRRCGHDSARVGNVADIRRFFALGGGVPGGRGFLVPRLPRSASCRGHATCVVTPVSRRRGSRPLPPASVPTPTHAPAPPTPPPAPPSLAADATDAPSVAAPTPPTLLEDIAGLAQDTGHGGGTGRQGGPA